jgi:hypothetical protein
MEVSSQLLAPTILPPCPLNSRLGGPWSWSGRFGEEINTLSQISSPCRNFTPESPNPWPSHNTGYTIPTTNYINQRKKIGNCTMDNIVLTRVLKEQKELKESLYCAGAITRNPYQGMFRDVQQIHHSYLHMRTKKIYTVGK